MNYTGLVQDSCIKHFLENNNLSIPMDTKKFNFIKIRMSNNTHQLWAAISNHVVGVSTIYFYDFHMFHDPSTLRLPI